MKTRLQHPREDQERRRGPEESGGDRPRGDKMEVEAEGTEVETEGTEVAVVGRGEAPLDGVGATSS